MSVRPEFGEQEILDIATGTVDLCDQIVGRGKRPHPLIDAGPDLWLILQDLMQNSVNRGQFVFKPVLKFVDNELPVLLLLNQAP